MDKQCSKCNEQKPLAAFNTRPDRKSGYRSECKRCQYQAQRTRMIPAVVSQARNNLHYAVKIGNMVKPEQCESCRMTTEVHAHHRDYFLPLDVAWLCVPCHNRLHRKERKSA